MRVIHIINSLETGGAEKLLIDSIVHYHKYAISVDVLILKRNNSPFHNRLKVEFKGNIFFSRYKSLYDPRHIFQIKNKVKNYDLVHVHLFPSLYWMGITRLFTKMNLKLIYTEHSTTNRRRNIFWKFFDRIIYGQYDKVITISTEVKHNLKKHLSKKDDFFQIIANGIDTSAFKTNPIANRESFKKENNYNVISISRFYYPKDQETLIKAIALLPTNVTLTLVGDGENKEKCVRLAKDLSIDDRIRFLGNRIDIVELLSGADIVVLSSHYEGVSLANIEGMASGRPFIGTKVPGIKELTEGAGILVDYKSHIQFSEEIMRLLKDVDYYYETVDKCLERGAQFDIQYMMDKRVALYRSLL